MHHQEGSWREKDDKLSVWTDGQLIPKKSYSLTIGGPSVRQNTSVLGSHSGGPILTAGQSTASEKVGDKEAQGSRWGVLMAENDTLSFILIFCSNELSLSGGPLPQQKVIFIEEEMVFD